MSNETKSAKSKSALLGAAFLMATSAIGPGFLTQTTQFTATYLASFAFVIVCVIIMDMVAQSNVWSVIGASGLRGQDLANRVLPGLGVFLAILVVIGGLAFNIGNVGGVALGLNAMAGIPEKVGCLLGGALAICIFLSKSGKSIMDRVAQVLGGIILIIAGLCLIVYYMSFGIFYDDDSFILTQFGKHSGTYHYRDIQSQQLYNATGNVVVELYMKDGRSVSLTDAMVGEPEFLDYAFQKWLKQTGKKLEDCSFHDPDNSCWFPPMED